MVLKIVAITELLCYMEDLEVITLEHDNIPAKNHRTTLLYYLLSLACLKLWTINK
jgi:hypothetical protein